ncbi:MAG: MarR family winged helix-turn-helix transcriptional regulator [Solirubrobacteraceae bacterium]
MDDPMGDEDPLVAVGFAPGMETATSPGSMVLLTRLARVVHRRSTEQLLGMRVKQFATLCFVRDHGGVLQSDLAEALYMDANNLVLLLNDLEAHGWIERRRDPEDRRRHIVEVTPSGERAIERAEHSMETIEEDVLSGLSGKERETLRRLLAKALEQQASATA